MLESRYKSDVVILEGTNLQKPFETRKSRVRTNYVFQDLMTKMKNKKHQEKIYRGEREEEDEVEGGEEDEE